LIGHPTIGLRQPPKAKVDNPISRASKWPVLARPLLAGFARPMTNNVSPAKNRPDIRPVASSTMTIRQHFPPRSANQA
jgi:hypothetical protein